MCMPKEGSEEKTVCAIKYKCLEEFCGISWLEHLSIYLSCYCLCLISSNEFFSENRYNHMATRDKCLINFGMNLDKSIGKCTQKQTNI